MATLTGVEIFAPGHWYPGNGPKEGVKFSKEFVQKLLKNTKNLLIKQLINPILKIGHTSERVADGNSKGIPLFGRAENFRLKGNKIIADFVGIPDLLLKAFKQKRLTNVSVEIRKNKKWGMFIDAIALLGTDSPAVKSLKDLKTFLSTGTQADILDFAVMSWDETENQWRARIRNPEDFREDTFRTKDLEGIQGIQIIVGRLKPDNVQRGADPESMVVQAYRFDKKNWTKESAEDWMTENNDFSVSNEDKEIVFEFSEPSFLNDFFQQPVNKDIIDMGEEKKNTGITPEKYAEVLKEASDWQMKFSTAEKEISELKEEIKSIKEAGAQNEKDEIVAELSAKKTELETLTASHEELKKELKMKDAELVKFAEKEKEILFASKKMQVVEPYKSDVEEGILPPAMLKEIEKHLDEQQGDFSADKELTISAALTRRIGQAYADKLPLGEQGEDDPSGEGDQPMKFANVTEQIDFEIAKLRAKNSGISYEQAIEMLFKMKPKLEKQYAEFSMSA